MKCVSLGTFSTIANELVPHKFFNILNNLRKFPFLMASWMIIKIHGLKYWSESWVYKMPRWETLLYTFLTITANFSFKSSLIFQKKIGGKNIFCGNSNFPPKNRKLQGWLEWKTKWNLKSGVSYLGILSVSTNPQSICPNFP